MNQGAITNKPNKFLKNATSKGCIPEEICLIEACIIENNIVDNIINKIPLGIE